MDFSDGQKKAIEHVGGPMLVLAGPGSGKTTVITYRLKYLVQEQNIHPQNILVITFTRAAAKEMKTRFEKLLPDVKGITFGTFHSVFFHILKQAYHYTSADIIDEQEKYQFVGKTIEKYNMKYDGQEDFARNVSAEIGSVKSELTKLDDYESKNMESSDFRMIYREYETYLRENNKLDFDDMLVFTYELLKERKDICGLWKKKFQYILIDEFQDINHIQYMIIKLLLTRDNNLFVVGDDDQSVYSFRGADPDIMLDFPKEFPDTEIAFLNTNYRCSRDIVVSSQRIIRNNQKRYDKKIKSAYTGKEAERVHVVDVPDVGQENGQIVDKISELGRAGISFGKMAVIYRTNTEPVSLAARLMEYNIPIKMRDCIPNIYHHFIAENIKDYIAASLGDRSRSLIMRIINKPNRYISRDAFYHLENCMEDLKEYYHNNRRIQQNITILETDLERIKKLKPYGAINYIRKAVGYDGYIKEYAQYRGINPQEYFDILEEIQEMARPYASFAEWYEGMERYAQKLKEQSETGYSLNDAVTLSTMHSAKGLEYDYVFILNAVEGMIPHKKSVTGQLLEEERRMFYVAVTRAKYGLYIYVPANIHGVQTEMSRFVYEMVLDKELLKEGNRVVHKQFGEGVITYVDDKKVRIYFDKIHSTKNLSIRFTMNNKLIAPAD